MYFWLLTTQYSVLTTYLQYSLYDVLISFRWGSSLKLSNMFWVKFFCVSLLWWDLLLSAWETLVVARIVFKQIHFLTTSPVHSLILQAYHSFIHSFVRSFIRSFVRSFIRTFIHSFCYLPCFYGFIWWWSQTLENMDSVSHHPWITVSTFTSSDRAFKWSQIYKSHEKNYLSLFIF